MKKSLNKKVVLVTRKTRLEELIAQYNTEEQAAFVIKSRGGDFQHYKNENQIYYDAVEELLNTIQHLARIQVIERYFLPNFIFGKEDTVIVVGQDGLVANTLKYLNGQPVIAINPNPDLFDGIILPFKISDAPLILSDVLNNEFTKKFITMAKASFNDGQELIAVNDLFIGPNMHVSAQYEIAVNGKKERQSSSGVIVSTGLGSTGWMKSIIAGAAGVLRNKGLSKKMERFQIDWNAQKLLYAVREPFPSNVTGTDLVFGEITKSNSFSIASQMANGGVVFSDGMISDAIEFNSGTSVAVSWEAERGVLVV